MSPRYDPPPRPGRRIFLGVLACGFAGALGVVVVIWLWSGRGAHGTGSEAPDEASAADATGGSSAGPDASSDGTAVVDPRAQQPPVIGETVTAAGTTAQGTGGVSSAPNGTGARGRSSGLASSPNPDGRGAGSRSGADLSARARDTAAASASSPAPRDAIGGVGAGVAAISSGPKTGTLGSPAMVSTTTASGSTTAPAPVPAPTPPSAQGSADGSVRPEIWTPAHDSDTGATGQDVPADHADRGTDRVPPVLDGLGFDPPQIDDGNPVRLMIHVHDDLAGIRTVTGNIRSPSARAVFSFEAIQADPNGSLYVATINIPPRAETGTWYVAYLYVPDRADNSLILSYTAATAPPGGTLNVSSRESDSTPPVIHDIVLTSASVAGGEHNHMRVDVDDDASGVASIVGSFKSPSGAALIPFICRLVPETQTWEGDVIVPQSADCGQWTINQVLATDKAGNAAVLQNPNPAIEHIGFQVVGSNCDDTAPVLETFSLAPTTVSNDVASEIIVTATISDVGSGATSMTGWATGPPATNGVTPKVLFACVPNTPSEPGSTWTGKIIVPQYAAKGTWRITRVRLQDRAQNMRDYTQADAIIANASFAVQ